MKPRRPFLCRFRHRWTPPTENSPTIEACARCGTCRLAPIPFPWRERLWLAAQFMFRR